MVRVSSLIFLLSAGCFADPFSGETPGSSSSSGGSSSDSSSCMSPGLWYADRDGDGWGFGEAIKACTPQDGFVMLAGDCDDKVAARYPGKIEVCDQLDNDCDGVIDEYSAMNTTCGDCGLAEYEGAPFWFCNDAWTSWVDAGEACAEFGEGVELASIRSQAESDWVKSKLFLLDLQLDPDETVWIGLRRIDAILGSCNKSTTDWMWVDGTPFEYTAWSSGQPDNFPTMSGCDPNCMFMDLEDEMCPRENCGDLIGNNGWNDVSCHLPGDGYICRG